MKKAVFLTLALTMGLLMSSYAAETKLIEVNNKICPISHEVVGENGMKPHKVTYNGKVYNLCCSMCEKDFKKDPAKYSKMLDQEAAAEQAAVKKM